MELIALYIVLGSLGLFGANKAVDVYKHQTTINADVYNSCVKHAESVRECRGLENP